MVEEYYKRLIISFQSPQWFWSDLFYILMIEFPYESNYKSKNSLEWEVNLEENVFVDDKETFKKFYMVENYDLYTLFGVIEEKEFFDESKKEEIAKIVGAHVDEKFIAEKEISHVVLERK